MTQHPGLSTTPSWHIASYPRSGNHLARSLVEFGAHRPTLGRRGQTIRARSRRAVAARSSRAEVDHFLNHGRWAP